MPPRLGFALEPQRRLLERQGGCLLLFYQAAWEQTRLSSKSLVSHCCTCSATLPFTAPEQVLDFAQRLQDKARKVGVQVTQHQDPGSRKKGSETSRPGTMKNTEESCVLNQILLSLWLFWNGVCSLCQVPLELWLHEGMFHDWVMHPDT